MKNKLVLWFICVLLLAACTIDAVTPSVIPPTQSPREESPIPSTPISLPPDASPVLISEILAGIEGNNNHEFIELYNRSADIIDLHGWSLWYRLPASQNDLFVYRWTSTTLIPPHGHLLLGFKGQNIGIQVDAQYDQAINITGGGIQLRKTDGTVLDTLGWGKPIPEYYESIPAPALANGISLERYPGGPVGNSQDLDDNSVDFHQLLTPSPQNTGSPLTPSPLEFLKLDLDSPTSAAPGSQFSYELTITNHCGTDIKNIQIHVPINSDLVVSDLPDGVNQEESVLTWNFPFLAKGASNSLVIPIEVPWTYFTASVNGYYATAEGCPLPAFGSPVHTEIEGGVIPVGTARTLLGADLTIEGIATTYTGSYYAGTGNVKLYLQDDTGGIQVQVFEGQREVNVKIGELVRVRGNVSFYRGSTQIVPIIVPNDITILATPSDTTPKPLPVTIQAASTDFETIPGLLVQVQGLVTRVEEFSYSYELDLADLDDATQQLTLYIDKQTGIQVEHIETGEQYIAVGILDIRDTRHLLYPRIQADLQRVFPPIPRLEVEAPPLVVSDEPITYTLAAYNYTSIPLTDATISVTLPAGTSLLRAEPSAVLENHVITWQLPEVPPLGSSYQVQFSVAVIDSTIEQVILDTAIFSTPDWPDPVRASPINTFTAGQVPIWAIQGQGFRSPYLFSPLTTQGIVTAHFPELSGFYIQETISDNDPLTSPGLFIFTGNADVDVHSGDLIEVTGQVREISGQTALQVLGPVGINLLEVDEPLPMPVELDPPVEIDQSRAYYEALEGALVQVSGPALAVSPNSKYGEVVLVLPKHNTDRIFQGEETGITIMADDGTDITHLDNSTMTYSVVTGDTVRQVTGPLAYTYENYKIEPVSSPVVERTGMQPAVLQSTLAGEFSLMTWNVENLFDPLDPNPSDPPKPLPSEYLIDLEKVANTILDAGIPSVVALQEVENLHVLEDLASHPIIAPYSYEAILIEGFDSRGIDVGYLIRRDHASILDVQQRDAPAGLFSRPPLLVQLEVHTGEQPTVVYLINNHFVSMSGGEEASEPQRTAQAAWNSQLVQEILTNDPEAYVAVMGDLNSYYESPPIQTLCDGGLTHVLDLLPPESRYTYIYQGSSQVLDHILITASFIDLLERVAILHVNADFPLAASDDVTSWHKSDHDPLVATFLIE